ncbi:hypothetical protein AAVH_31777 [Aphelenchoides avenae]|nr:hypothetical protein AAVH_31777 [Aphelenchus avenae]
MPGNFIIKKSAMDERMENFAIGSIVKALAVHETDAKAQSDVRAAMERVFGGHWACIIDDDLIADGKQPFEFAASFNGKEISLFKW